MERKQLKRGVKGWRMLPNSRSVARPSRWGNPYRVYHSGLNHGWFVGDGWRTIYAQNNGYWTYWTKGQATRKVVELYREYAVERLKREPDWLDPLRGLDYLYCWCAEDAPLCHADVLIELLGGK